MMKMIISTYLPYMICMYVHVHEKRNDLEYQERSINIMG